MKREDSERTVKRVERGMAEKRNVWKFFYVLGRLNQNWLLTAD
jgi:hypothetical protein